MALITKKDIERMDGIHSETCISIFVPAHRVGVEVLQGGDVLKLKNQLKAVKEKLALEERGPKEIEMLLAPIRELLGNRRGWPFFAHIIFLKLSPFQ